MSTEHQPDSIRQAVLDKVRTGAVRRRPRAYFLVRVIATVVLSLVLLVVSTLVLSFILFSLHESGQQFLIGFGVRGIQVFLQLFPWILAGTAFVLMLVLEWLLRGFKFGYRIPLLHVFLGILGISIVLSVLINFTPLHATLLQTSRRGELPLVGNTYQHILDHHDDQGVCRGRVIAMDTDSLTLQHDDHDRDKDDGTFTVHTSGVKGLPRVYFGDELLVFGDTEEGCAEATYIQILSGPK